MTISTSVHSNAFNFMSFIQNGVDPRTGQYTVSLTLPDIKTNGLRGPGVPLVLSYNPLNTEDSGFGLGWNLQLSQYLPGSGIISLSSGETFKVDGAQGDQLTMSEKKLDSFHFYREDDTHYRVMHKSGLMEVFETLGATGNKVAMPTRILAPEGNSVTLSYVPFNSAHMMLSEVKDDEGQVLLDIRREETAVYIRLSAAQGAVVEFVLTLGGSDRTVTRVEMPTDNAASWRFEYGLVREHMCMTAVDTPLGGHEAIFYQDAGHAFPVRAKREPLPRVSRHLTTPGSGQAEVDVHYTYADSQGREHNFLGAGLDIAWEDNGLDNLYLYRGSDVYEYESTETLRVEDADVRSIRRVFNQFHLLTSETTTQNNACSTVETAYYLSPEEPFYAQLNYCQLPKAVKTTWRSLDKPLALRTESVASIYDNHGNLLVRTQANGMVETSTWYPAAGEDGCPPDPEGFVRTIKSKTVTPAPSDYGQAATLTTRYRYISLAATTGSEREDWITVESESLVQLDSGPGRLVQESAESEQVLQQTTYTYINTPDDAFQHGRVSLEELTMSEQVTATKYVYSTLMSPDFGESVLRTVQTVTGFDDAKKTITLEHSLLNGEPLLNRDDNDVEIRYVYDNLRRVLSETVAPDTDYEATRRYEYQLCAASTDFAEQHLFDVKGVQTCSRFDGLQRVIYEERDDVDSPVYVAGAGVARQTYAAVYDAWGHLVSETEYDWTGEQSLALAKMLEYDDWGEQRCVTGPDGVKTVEETDPVGTLESQGPIQRSWTESTGEPVIKTGVSETWLNLFDKPVRSVRLGLDLEGEPLSLSRYHYDGLGRSVEEIVGHPDLERSTLYVYDAFDRVIETTLPDDSIVSHTFAAHSSEDLPVSVSVKHNGKLSVLGEQVYDGLDRMVKTITGGRERTFVFDPGQPQPKKVTTPSGQVIDYDYQPQLGSEPLQRKIFGATANYKYDQHNARLLHSDEQGEQLDRDYYSTGLLKSEKRISEGSEYTMHYQYSRLGRLLSYTDVLGQEQTNQYDDKGRLTQTSLGTLCSDFTYDALGRTASITTHDSAGGQHVAINLEYDELGREVLRTFDLNGTEQCMVQAYDDVDDMIKRTLSDGAGTLRDEDYRYDKRGRLVGYDCAGPQQPVDAYGNHITGQIFSFDGINNLTLVMTMFEGESNRARYFYEGADPAQLTRVTNTVYTPEELRLVYDLDGNLILDEAGRTLTYDPLGRLIEVSTPGAGIHYRYDPQDQLAGETRDGDQDQRFYRDGALANQLGGSQSSTFMRGDGYLLAEQQSDKALLLATDGSDSVLSEVHANEVDRRSYTAYGQADSEGAAVGRLGYNGELAERDTGWQMLGNGYRAYNPVLMRFHSPDSLSPFGEGGLNAYAYVEGDPVNGADPTGHSLFGTFIRFFTKAPFNTAANSSIPKALLNSSKDTPVRLRRMTTSTVKHLEKRAILKERALKEAERNLKVYEDRLQSAAASGKRTSNSLVAEHSSAKENFSIRGRDYGQAKKDYEYAADHKGERIITKEVRSVLKNNAKQFDIDEAITARQQRADRYMKDIRNPTQVDPKAPKNYLGVSNQ